MSGCPICGVDAEARDQSFTGQRCNLLKPLLRLSVPVRKVLQSAVERVAR